MMTLSRKTLAEGQIKVEANSISSRKPVRILQMGDGNFLRAFVDWAVDVTNGKGAGWIVLFPSGAA